MMKTTVSQYSRVLLLSGFLLTITSAAFAQGGPPAGRGPGAPDMQTIHGLFANSAKIRRSVTNLPNGIAAVTESDDPLVAKKLKEHVAAMKERLKRHEPIRQWDPLFAALFQNADKFKLTITPTPKGIKITETSDDAYAVKLLQAHAKAVSGFVREGMAAMPTRHELPKNDRTATADYTRTTPRKMQGVLDDIKAAAVAEGFKVVGTHDVAASFKSAGIERTPYVVLELCNAKIASDVLIAEPRFGALIPCRLAVYEQTGTTVVTTILPSRIAALFSGNDVQEAARTVDAVLMKIIDTVTTTSPEGKPTGE